MEASRYVNEIYRASNRRTPRAAHFSQGFTTLRGVYRRAARPTLPPWGRQAAGSAALPLSEKVPRARPLATARTQLQFLMGARPRMSPPDFHTFEYPLAVSTIR